MSSHAPAPLTGVVILDLTQIYNGPYATFLMARAGATVIKVEPPGGEHLRKRHRSSGVCEPFGVLNSNKLSVCLDLKDPDGVQTLLKMVSQADVIVNNFAPGAMDRLGLSNEVIRQANPDIIIACSTGYGTSGRYRNYPAMDLTLQAMSGFMSITGSPETPPLKAGPAVCDFLAGIHLYGAIMTALYERAATGRASEVEVSMLDSAFPTMLSSLGMHKLGDTSCKRTGNRHGGLTMAPYNVYPAADGNVAILAVSEAHWSSLTDVLGKPQWKDDPKFCNKEMRVKNMDLLDESIGELTARIAKQDLFEMLVKARIPSAPVRELDEVIQDQHLHETGMLSWVEHPEYGHVLAHGSPLKFEGHDMPQYQPSKRLGADTEHVLKEMLGLDSDDVERVMSVTRGA
ncbi:CaiB/BaiF CoA transferase family protein [Orrella marina]|uniref:CoA transferase n=1 Tax=Orrella marina TaxID=2163011 RepID=A0A2R4XG57_9BURK|nr:CoA transferase [Orrella marina]AWB32797.1 CoA transferase [Orrella marina]